MIFDQTHTLSIYRQNTHARVKETESLAISIERWAEIAGTSIQKSQKDLMMGAKPRWKMAEKEEKKKWKGIRLLKGYNWMVPRWRSAMRIKTGWLPTSLPSGPSFHPKSYIAPAMTIASRARLSYINSLVPYHVNDLIEGPLFSLDSYITVRFFYY